MTGKNRRDLAEAVEMSGEFPSRDAACQHLAHRLKLSMKAVRDGLVLMGAKYVGVKGSDKIKIQLPQKDTRNKKRVAA